MDATEPYSTAKGFCHSAFIMMANPDRLQANDDTAFVLSFHHLIGFAVELYLKSFLIHRGYPENDLKRKPYGHKLSNLLSKAKEEGFDCEQGSKLVDYLPQHETFEYRYMRNDTRFSFHHPNEMFGLLLALDIYTDESIGASASLGKKPQGYGWFLTDRKLRNWRLPS